VSITNFLPDYRRRSLLEVLGDWRLPRLIAIAAIHLAALYSLLTTEYGTFGVSVALLSWGLLNFFWLVVLRRPGLSAALSLAVVQAVIVLSRFKFDVTWMTITFLDVLIIDSDTIAFVLSIFPHLRLTAIVAAMLAVPLLVLLWRLDPFRIRRRIALLGGALCLAGIVGLSFAVPEHPTEPFQGVNHLSSFARSGVVSGSQLVGGGWLESESSFGDRLKPAMDETCRPAGKPPHIVMVLDESSFDISAAPGVKVPADYRRHFRSFDGKTRSFVAEVTGGQTWHTEYNVLSGLSARSYGQMKFYVTRIAAGHVERGLPQALRRCGYRTFSLYPAYGAFLSARKFQTGTGVDQLIDAAEMGAGDVEPDHFYYDKAARLIGRERGAAPLFLFVYTVANHFPWNSRFRPDLTPAWRDPGNEPDLDEYIRRQTMSARDYADFVARLQREFPNESFLLVRFGDHQPNFAAKILEPAQDDAAIAEGIRQFDPRYYTTYYAVDAVNFAPVDLASALDRLDAPYLPLAVLGAAGIPLDPSFAEQKRILERCHGEFYRCGNGAEARRFNKLLIDAGLIKGL
jgi:Sulfatase